MKVKKQVKEVEVVRKNTKTVEEEIVTLEPQDIREAIEIYVKRHFPDKQIGKMSICFLHEVVSFPDKQAEIDAAWNGSMSGVPRLTRSEFYGAKVIISSSVLNEVEVIQP